MNIIDREIVSPKEMSEIIDVRKTKYPSEKVNKLHANLAVPSYVHGYSLAIQYMYNWFQNKFDKDYFKGGIYIDGKHVLDDYKSLNDKAKIKRVNPRARIEPRVQFDFDRETIDTYLAPPNLYLRKSSYNESFFKDYDRDMFLGLDMKALRMDFNFKVRVNTRSQQLDVYNKMNMDFRIGSTMQDNISVDFHIPKDIIINIAKRAQFKVVNGDVVDIIDFLEYLNSHSDLPFLFKIRAINQKPEYFIRINNLYTHINCVDKLSLDDGERDGKLDFNFHVEMNAVLTIPIPSFYSFYSASEFTLGIEAKNASPTAVALYSINAFDIPNVDENGWIRAAITDYSTDANDTYMDLSPIFTDGDSSLSKAIKHTLTKGLSPYHFINIMVYEDDDVPKECVVRMDWNNMRAYFENAEVKERLLHIAIYYDRQFINELDIELGNYNKSRITSV